MVMRPTQKKIFGVLGIDNLITLGIMVASTVLTVNSAYQQLKLTMDMHGEQLKTMRDIQAQDHDKINSVAQKIEDMNAQKREQIAGK
jgi:hypothetical protein